MHGLASGGGLGREVMKRALANGCLKAWRDLMGERLTVRFPPYRIGLKGTDGIHSTEI